MTYILTVLTSLKALKITTKLLISNKLGYIRNETQSEA
jgi:hypothetical protein